MLLAILRCIIINKLIYVLLLRHVIHIYIIMRLYICDYATPYIYMCVRSAARTLEMLRLDTYLLATITAN